MVCVLVAACGGKVVVDGLDDGVGGSSSASSGTSTSPTTSGGTTNPGACTDIGSVGCVNLDDTCDCTAECEGDDYEAVCDVAAQVPQCTCLINGVVQGTCQESGQACDLFGGCCEAFFPFF